MILSEIVKVESGTLKMLPHTDFMDSPKLNQILQELVLLIPPQE